MYKKFIQVTGLEEGIDKDFIRIEKHPFDENGSVKIIHTTKKGYTYTMLSVSEVITKREYNAQVGVSTHLTLSKGGSNPILVSLGDALQILSILQNDENWMFSASTFSITLIWSL